MLKESMSFKPAMSKQASKITEPYLTPKVSLVTVKDLLRKDTSTYDRNVNMFAISIDPMGIGMNDEELMGFPSADFKKMKIKVEKF
jgi:hypothetical protein